VAAGALLPTTFNISGPPLHARISSPTLSPGWPEPLKAFMYNRKRAMPVLSSISEKGPAPQPQIHLADSLFKEEHGLSLFLSLFVLFALGVLVELFAALLGEGDKKMKKCVLTKGCDEIWICDAISNTLLLAFHFLLYVATQARKNL
jgi:hypothetical protein